MGGKVCAPRPPLRQGARLGNDGDPCSNHIGSQPLPANLHAWGRRERPRRHAAEQRDGRAPPDAKFI